MNNLTTGYNSYGNNWVNLIKLKNLELDRGNHWFDDSLLDLEKTVAIWVTVDPRDAVLYNLGGTEREIVDEYFDLTSNSMPLKVPSEFKNEISRQEYQELLNSIQNPKDYCSEVDLEGATSVISHKETFGLSFLFIKPIFKE